MDDRALALELLGSSEPSLRWLMRRGVLGDDPDSRTMVRLREEIRTSPRAKTLRSHTRVLGRIGTNRRVYYKWQGLQWTFQALADLGYPEGDRSLRPAHDRMVDLWLAPAYYQETTRPYPAPGVHRLEGRYRRCASQQGNALRSSVLLGLDDARAGRLAERLRHWQWPDGGWNCDRDPSADTSSFLETLLPMTALAAYGQRRHDAAARTSARRAAEVFLTRRLFRRRSDGRVIKPQFVALHYPRYYYYDVLGGLLGMAAVGRLGDPRCADALDYLESRRLPGGGWPAEGAFGQLRPTTFQSRGEWVRWGPHGARTRNDWVSAQALTVLHEAGRFAM